MRVQLAWLTELVPQLESMTPQDVADLLTGAGVEVDEIGGMGPSDVDGVYVGEVVEIDELTEFKKPIRDCKVRFDDGTDPARTRGIVCGASNFAVGDTVAMTYGHRTGYRADPVRDRIVPVPPDLDPLLGIYVAHMGPICANGLLHAAVEEFGRDVRALGDGVRGAGPRQAVPSRSMAQHRTNSRRAMATMAGLRRVVPPRVSRCQMARAQSL